jgi:hypothetical protein
VGEQRPSEPVGADRIAEASERDDRYVGHGVDELRRPLGETRLVLGGRSLRAFGGCPGEVEQVLGLRVVHVQGAGDPTQYALGHSAEIPAFHPGVVRRTHAGELGNLFATQAGDPALATEDGHAGLLGSEASPHPGEELLHVAVEVHTIDGSPPGRGGGSVCECLPVPVSGG